MASLEEAETALLTLGGVLEWEECSDSVGQVVFDSQYLDPEEMTFYEVTGLITAYHCLGQQPVYSSAPYNTIAEAKAACEVHAATGTFPPGVTPMLPASVDQNQDQVL